MSDWLPRDDNDFNVFAGVFADTIAAAPATYLLTPADGASLQGVAADFAAKLAISNTEATRTRLTIADKDDARSACESLIRQYAMVIKQSAGIADADKIAIGVRPLSDSREPVECPQTSPIVNILHATPGLHELRYSDSTTPDSRARPHGASELQLFLAITDEEPGNVDEASFYGKFTRNPINVQFSTADDGKLATYYARWASPRGETGPWSIAESMRIAA
jgi:uncharacterized small protein (DUF1192 family)